MGSITPTPTRTSPPYPLHPSILPHLDPVYLNFYNTHLINSQVVHHQPLSVSRSSSILLPGASDPVSVGEVRDLQIPFPNHVNADSKDGQSERDNKDGQSEEDNKDGKESRIPIRAFIPAGPTPKGGWPLCMYFHGGGWVLGGIDTENTVCSHLCKRGEVVVVTPRPRKPLPRRPQRLPNRPPAPAHAPRSAPYQPLAARPSGFVCGG
ncbi:Alpha beta hydrolase fold-3 protein [Rutstroemia sp. NJR-2017a BBW]|nr:Alpha beta hydrolase fold-3 protein [Rutstroemia sp. NJR-2017a BBW]